MTNEKTTDSALQERLKQERARVWEVVAYEVEDAIRSMT